MLFTCEETPEGIQLYSLLAPELTQIKPNYEAMIRGGHLKVTDMGIQHGRWGFCIYLCIDIFTLCIAFTVMDFDMIMQQIFVIMQQIFYNISKHLSTADLCVLLIYIMF